jgi:hypothetical protein
MKFADQAAVNAAGIGNLTVRVYLRWCILNSHRRTVDGFAGRAWCRTGEGIICSLLPLDTMHHTNGHDV